MRFTPSLTFVADAIPENARTIEDLLARARASDEEVRKTATDATYAGDADPYRKPEDEDEDEDGADADVDADADVEAADGTAAADGDEKA